MIECWEWIGGVRKGKVYGKTEVDGKTVGVHRVSYRWAYGDIPQGMFVCHKCDNTLCVRPDHLFLGTHNDNMRDRDNKGRTIHGELHKSARLTEQQVKDIRAEYATSEIGCRRLGKKYGVGRRTISDIIRGKTWKHVM